MSLARINLLSKILSLIVERRGSKELQNKKRLDRFFLLETQRKFVEIKSLFIDYFIREGFDALITPVLSCPSIAIGQEADFMHFYFSTHYSILLIWLAQVFPLVYVNILDMLTDIMKYKLK